MLKSAVDLGLLYSLSTPARYRKIEDCIKFAKKVPKVIEKEGADVDSRSTNKQ